MTWSRPNSSPKADKTACEQLNPCLKVALAISALLIVLLFSLRCTLSGFHYRAAREFKRRITLFAYVPFNAPYKQAGHHENQGDNCCHEQCQRYQN
jgi:hypothetical protein